MPADGETMVSEADGQAETQAAQAEDAPTGEPTTAEVPGVVESDPAS
jgi:hypothetical protein